MRLMRYSPTVMSGRAVAEDGADELEEGEDEEEGGEGEENDGEVGGVLAHDVVVEQERELDAERRCGSGGGGWRCRSWNGRWAIWLPLTRRVTSLLRPNADGGEDAEGDASARHLVEENGASGGEEQVGSPDAEEGRELAGLGEGRADFGEQVIDEDENDGEDEAGGFASALWRRCQEGRRRA